MGVACIKYRCADFFFISARCAIARVHGVPVLFNISANRYRTIYCFVCARARGGLIWSSTVFFDKFGRRFFSLRLDPCKQRVLLEEGTLIVAVVKSHRKISSGRCQCIICVVRACAHAFRSGGCLTAECLVA